MKQYWIKREGRKTVRLFFAGWGMDEHLALSGDSPEHDLMLCFDYRNLEFQPEELRDYTSVEVIGWSMGVWAATALFARLKEKLHCTYAIAYNGTVTPIHNTEGIAQAIYEKTLGDFSEWSVQKFNRRMCGSAKATTSFEPLKSQRDINELKEELYAIKEQSQQSLPPTASFAWNEAWIGTKDLIFSYDNQLCAWEKHPETRIKTDDSAHFDHSIIQQLLKAPITPL